MFRRALTLRAVLLLILVGLSLPFTAPAAAAGGSAAPTTAGPGTRVHFTATGFTPGERIDLWVSGPDGRTRTRYPAVTADASGAAVWSWDVAASDPNGAWTMSARGVSSGLVAAIPFAVSGTGMPSSTLAVNPANASAGTTFAFAVTGLTPGKAVGAWLITPAGTSQDLVPRVDPGLIADASGALSWSWTAPADAAGGTWQMVVRDLSTSAEQQVAFTIVSPAQAAIRSVSPASGAPGTDFTVTVGGFTPGEQVGSWLISPDGTSVDATPYLVADGQGVVTWSWVSPANAQSGAWRAVTRGATSGVQVALDLTVTGTNGAPATTRIARGTMSPASGTAGTIFRFSLDGFAPTEQVAYWPTQPDGTVEITRRAPLTTDDDGRVVLSWTAPARTQPGVWTMTFEGLSSDRVLTLIFKVGAEQVDAASVSPASGAPGTTFSFSASGFNVIEQLDTWLERPDAVLIAGPTGARADGAGVATWTWTAPSEAPGGSWTLVARGQDSGVTYRIPFTVEGATAPAAPAVVTPTAGSAGTSFTFTASGFVAGERVGYWLNLPDGSLQRFAHELGADKDGIITWSYTAPAGAPAGTYVMAARSSQSDGVEHNLSYALPFVVR